MTTDTGVMPEGNHMDRTRAHTHIHTLAVAHPCCRIPQIFFFKQQRIIRTENMWNPNILKEFSIKNLWDWMHILSLCGHFDIFCHYSGCLLESFVASLIQTNYNNSSSQGSKLPTFQSYLLSLQGFSLKGEWTAVQSVKGHKGKLEGPCDRHCQCSPFSRDIRMHTVSQISMVEYAARARVRQPELVPVGIGNTIALCISSNRETMTQEDCIT